MAKGKDLLGLPVVELSSGQEVGRVEDIVLDLETGKIKGLRLKPAGWLFPRQWLDFSLVREVGPHAVIFELAEEGEDEKKKSEGEREKESEASSEKIRGVKDLRGQRVLAPEGREIGIVEDVEVDAFCGAIRGWEVSPSLLSNLLGERIFLPSAEIALYGADRIITREDRGGG